MCLPVLRSGPPTVSYKALPNHKSTFLIVLLFTCPAVKTKSHQVCSPLPVCPVELKMASIETLNQSQGSLAMVLRGSPQRKGGCLPREFLTCNEAFHKMAASQIVFYKADSGIYSYFL